MKNCNTIQNRTRHPVLSSVTAAALAAACAISLPQGASADDTITPPPVPTGLEVGAGQHAFLVGHAFGTQNYICVPSGAGFAWTLFTPQATLFNDTAKQVVTHFFSPNPKIGTVQATWQHSRDTSAVWGQVVAASSDSNFVAPGAIPWLKVAAAHTQDGPTGGDTLSGTTFIQRLNTSGGSAPATGCAQATDVGGKAFVPYTADYFFYTDQVGD